MPDSQVITDAGSEKIDVLDHGFVRLIDHMGDDLSVVRAARVSYAAAWRAGENEGSDRRLIKYLWRNRHTTPFEAVTFTFEVMAPIFNFRQWHRHRIASYNELSARYRELPETFYIPSPDLIGLQSTSNKQGRELIDDPAVLERRLEQLVKVRKHCERAFALYRELLSDNWPKELARMVLPFNTYSHMFVTLNLHSLFHFLQLRLHPHAQHEIRVYVEAMLELIKPIVPASVEAFQAEDPRDERVRQLEAEIRDLVKGV